MLHDPWSDDRAMKPGRLCRDHDAAHPGAKQQRREYGKGAVRGSLSGHKVSMPVGTRRDSHAEHQRERALARKTELDRIGSCRKSANGDALRQKDRDTG